MRRIISSLLALSFVTTNPVAAADDDNWWFDVEVVLFARDTSVSEVAELFEQQSQLSPPETDWDLLSDYYQPDITMVYNSLPECNAPPSPLWADKPTLDDILTIYTLPDEPQLQEVPGDAQSMNETGGISATPDDSSATSQADYNQADSSQDEPLFGDAQNETRPGDALINNSDVVSGTLAPPSEPLTTPPPSLTKIAGYWLSYVLNDAQLTPFTVPAKRLDCVASRQPELVTNLHTTDNWHWQQADLRIPVRQQTMFTPEGVNWKRANGPHLLPGSKLKQDELFTSIRWRKGLQRLAHFSWRQQVKFGQDNAETLRLFAGQNYAEQFTITGEQRPQQVTQVAKSNRASTAPDTEGSAADEPADSFFSELNSRLANPQPVSFASMMTSPESEGDSYPDGSQKELPPIWQLDGFIQVYLKYLNRVPYLHINSELFYRQPVLTGTTTASDGTSGTVPNYELVSVPFKQLRRVISTQLHYFDHPLFGMVVQIRRYQRPPAPQPTESQDQN